MWGGGLGGSASAGDVLQTFVQTEGDDTLPLSVAAFNAEVRAATGVSEEKPVPGFNKYYPILRKGHVDTVFVHGDDSIPESRVFNYQQPCHECHPGLCKAVDIEMMPMIEAVAKEAHKIPLPALSGHSALLRLLEQRWCGQEALLCHCAQSRKSAQDMHGCGLRLF